ncbi:Rust resistance kinase Lr10 [Vitis vinifera]|uniref:Rust resistance kinase Lr10 n=1 Tax=Vitis vinifera TaxID=29760 RepID=A0A438DEC5_VITVI|nr:Rust resistance kinase Lr10 [Vitis vinifera]
MSPTAGKFSFTQHHAAAALFSSQVSEEEKRLQKIKVKRSLFQFLGFLRYHRWVVCRSNTFVKNNTGILGIGASQDDCQIPSSCSEQGPLVQFPFRLKDQPHSCGYPGFELACVQKKQTMLTMLELPNSVKLMVKKINYKSQEITRKWYKTSPSSTVPHLRKNQIIFSPSIVPSGTQFMLFPPPLISIPWIYSLAMGFTGLISRAPMWLIGGIIFGFFILMLVLVAVYHITNKFKEKLGEGGYGTVYKGKLSNDILVAVKVLNNSKGNGEEFINEVGTMGRIHHINVVRLVGFCADGSIRALIYEFLPNESLEKFIFSVAGENHSLGWEKLQHIAIGIAKGIEYLHQGKSVVSMTVARGTIGYIAPEVLSRNFGNASHKSDVYSFGMLLLEMVGGRKNIDATVENTGQVYFPEWFIVI